MRDRPFRVKLNTRQRAARGSDSMRGRIGGEKGGIGRMRAPAQEGEYDSFLKKLLQSVPWSDPFGSIDRRPCFCIFRRLALHRGGIPSIPVLAGKNTVQPTTKKSHCTSALQTEKNRSFAIRTAVSSRAQLYPDRSGGRRRKRKRRRRTVTCVENL